MININNKQFRNLQEQVAFLTSMIGQATDVVKKIVGIVATAEELPDEALYSPGDTFAVGAESPYEYYVKIDNAWVDIGQFPAEGPAGEDGNDGKSVILYTGNVDDISTTYLPIADLLVSDNLNVADIIFTLKGNVFIIEDIEAVRVRVLYKFNIKPVVFENVELLGTTTAENIIVSGDTVLDNTEVLGTLSIIDATDAHEAVSKGQMDTALLGKIDKVETAGSGIYAHASGVQLQLPYSQSAVNSTIAQRTAVGNIKAADPLVNNDVATKYYVDSSHPITSVNTKIGEVVLSASDIKANNAATIQSNLERIDSEINRVEAEIPVVDIQQTTGYSSNSLMSQKAITESLDEKADIDGYYSTLGAGTAEQLLSNKKNVDKSPYLFRTSGGSISIGNRVNEKYIEGGSIVRNQLIKNANKSGSNIGTDDRAYLDFWIKGSDSLLLRKYIYEPSVVQAIFDCTANLNDVNFFHNGHLSNIQLFTLGHKLVKNHKYLININFTGIDVSTAGGVTWDNAMLFDLTQMFGSVIAEKLTLLDIDDALELIKPWIDVNKYYEFNDGTLEHVNLLQKKLTGFNQWDEEWEAGGIDHDGMPLPIANRIRSKNYIPCLPNTAYYCYNGEFADQGGTILYCYDENKNLIENCFTVWGSPSNHERIGNTTFTTPANASYFKFYTMGNQYNNNICINISWSGTHNGEYKQYEEHTYSMPTGELRGIPKIVDNQIVYDGDRHYADGHTERRYGSYNLKNASWSKGTVFDGSGDSRFAYHLDIGKNVADNSIVPPAYMKNRVAYSYTYLMSGTGLGIEDGFCYLVSGDTLSLQFRSILQTATEWRDYIQTLTDEEATIYFELKTPTTEQGTSYTDLQVVDDWGSEEFIPVDGNIMPVGHYSEYSPNLRDKLDNLPNNANADGLYLVKQVGSQQSLELAVKELPSTAGLDNAKTYALKVVNGTLTWVEEA